MSADNICNIRQNCGSTQYGTIRRHYNCTTITQKRIRVEFMKKWNLKFNQILVLSAFAAVIAFPRISFNGVLSGLKLWGEVILPGLFPAMILTSCILYLFPLKPGLSYLYVCVTGLLCGFPVGAFLCSKLHEANPTVRTSDAVLQPFKSVICYQLHSFFFFKRKYICLFSPAVHLSACSGMYCYHFSPAPHTNADTAYSDS